MEWRADLETRYSTNPFRYSDEALSDFDDDRGAGERFDGLDSEGDLVTTLGVKGEVGFALDSKRDLTLALGVEHSLFLQNSIADYTELGAGLEFEATRVDTFSLGAEFVPSRFKKNYRTPGGGPFDAAEYDQIELGVEYERELGKRWSAGVGYERQDRSFPSDFDARDREGDTFYAFVENDPKGPWEWGVEVAFGTFDTGTELKGTVEVDRSNEQIGVSPWVRRKFDDWRVELAVDYRQREYTTNVAADDRRFDRVDDKYRLKIEAERKLGVKGLRLLLHAGLNLNDAGVEDPCVTSDEVGYEEYVVGIGLQYRF